MKRKKEQIVAESLPLVAIDLGSDGVRVMAAESISPERLHILGVEESRRFHCVENGVIVQASNAGYMISECLKLLANRIHCKELPTTFVSVGGKTTRVVDVHAKRDQIKSKLIEDALLRDMEAECKEKIEKKYPKLVVLGLVPNYFKLDGEEHEGLPEETQRARFVEGYYHAFVAQRQLDEQLQKSFDHACKSIEQSFIRQEALLSAFISEDGYEIVDDGCALIDFGAETTSLTIFGENEYLLHKVFDKGGAHITQAIMQKGFSVDIAERLKIQFGFASPDMVEKDTRYRITSSTGNEAISISVKELSTIIQTTLDTIINPVMSLIEQYADKIKYVYITGGASMLQGVDEYIAGKTSLTVRYGAHNRLIDSDEYIKPTYSALVGTLLLGADYRREHKGAKVPEPRPLQKIGEALIDFFSKEEQKMNRD